ncbi:ComF family protein [Leucobacter sp. BZR 635]
MYDAAALLWPTACVGCGAFDRDLCVDCRREVAGQGPHNGPVWRSSQPVRVAGLGVPGFAAAAYAGPLRGALVAYKHEGIHSLVRPLGQRLASTLASALDDPASCARRRASARAVDPRNHGAQSPLTLIVPLPSRPSRVRERGWKHVDELVRVALRRGNFPLMLCPALQSLPGRTGQVGLDPIARERNARRVRVRRVSERRLRGRSVILVDDIVTTGASMRAAIAVLERAGARVEAVVALATAVRRDSPQKTEWNLTGERG